MSFFEFMNIMMAKDLAEKVSEEVDGFVKVLSRPDIMQKSLDNYGYILTNYHVINGGSKYIVTFSDGEEVEASLVSGDEYYDIAVLKVDKDKVLIFKNRKALNKWFEMEFNKKMEL